MVYNRAMSTLAIINTNPEIKNLVELAFKNAPKQLYDLLFLEHEDDIFEFLDFTLPELVVVNFSEQIINIEKIIDHIINDKWILNLGIIGIFSYETDKEEDLLKKYKAINVLTLLERYQIRTHLLKCVQIIEQNFQIIFQREITQKLIEGASGSFSFDNNPLNESLYSGIGATILAQRGLINPDIKMHLQMALAELIINAIEHGNCGISYEEKMKALSSGMGISDAGLIAEKCKNPAIKAKKVTLSWEIKQGETLFTICDEGEGFDVKAYLEKMRNQDRLSLHGRGLRIVMSFSFKLKYNLKGNLVILTVKHDSKAEHEVPIGFLNEQIIHVKKGSTVISEGEASNFLYYISSGTYEVLHNGKPVGHLSSEDIFMGEMSFLLNQRRSATIKATSDGKLILLTQKTFVNVIKDYPHYGIFLSKLLAKRLVRSNERTAKSLGDSSG
jgi:anti-sigma regulatory factor (Ser/Thr protein kinase)